LKSFFEGAFFDRKAPAALIIFALVVIIYSGTLYAPFEFDDNEYIIQNPVIRDLGVLLEPLRSRAMIVSDSLVGYTFRSRYIGYLTFAMNFRLGGLDVEGYHIVNIVIHIINSLLVYGVLALMMKTPYVAAVRNGDRSFSRIVPFFVSALFACHPVQTQAVTYISQRFASLSALFCLLSFLLYLKWRLSGSASGRVTTLLYAGSLLSAAAAMTTKEISFVLPLLIALFEFMFMEGGLRRRAAFLVPFFLAAGLVPLNMINIDKPFYEWFSDIGSVARAKTTISRSGYLFTQFSVIVTYLRLLFLPVNQSLDYDFPLYESFFEGGVLVPLLLLLSIAALGGCLWRRPGAANRFTAFGIFWFFIALSVESSIIPTNDLAFEHRLYLPSAGFFIAFVSSVVALHSVIQKKYPLVQRYAAVLFLMVVVVFSIAAYERNGIWNDGETLWQDVILKSPKKARGYNELGRVYYGRNETNKAITEYKKAAALLPSFAWAHHNLSLAYYKQGLYDEALREANISMELGMSKAIVFGDLGAIYFKKGMLKEAADCFMAAVEEDSTNANAYYNLAVVYRTMGIEDKALENFEKARRLRPDTAGP